MGGYGAAMHRIIRELVRWGTMVLAFVYADRPDGIIYALVFIGFTLDVGLDRD